MQIGGPNSHGGAHGNEGPCAPSPKPANGSARHPQGAPRSVFAFTIASDFAAARPVQEAILSAVHEQGFGDNDVFVVTLALEEALINAIKHGNKLDARKTVRVDAAVTPEEIEITITDQGAGFRREDVPDCTLDENLEKPSGRGIHLIESFMTKAEWTDGGRTLRMYKKRDASLVPKA